MENKEQIRDWYLTTGSNYSAHLAMQRKAHEEKTGEAFYYVPEENLINGTLSSWAMDGFKGYRMVGALSPEAYDALERLARQKGWKGNEV